MRLSLQTHSRLNKSEMLGLVRLHPSGDKLNCPHAGVCAMMSPPLSDGAESLWGGEFANSCQRAHNGELCDK
jgi:hypothetical protein